MSMFGWTAVTIFAAYFAALWLAHRLQPEDDEERQP